MTPIETSPLTRKLSAFVALSEDELAVLSRLHQRRRSFVAGRDLVHQGQSDQAAYILSAGWVCSYKIQSDGTRQIVDWCCQTNANASHFALERRTSGHAKPPPLCECGGAVRLENLSAGESAFLVEVVVDGGKNGCEHLQTSHPPEPQHRPPASSKPQV